MNRSSLLKLEKLNTYELGRSSHPVPGGRRMKQYSHPWSWYRFLAGAGWDFLMRRWGYYWFINHTINSATRVAKSRHRLLQFLSTKTLGSTSLRLMYLIKIYGCINAATWVFVIPFSIFPSLSALNFSGHIATRLLCSFAPAAAIIRCSWRLQSPGFV